MWLRRREEELESVRYGTPRINQSMSARPRSEPVDIKLFNEGLAL